MLALTKDDVEILRVREGISLSYGDFYISPTEAGWSHDGYSLIEVDDAPAQVMAISPFQARAALFAAGLLDDVEAAIQAEGPPAVLAWEYATEWRRDSPTIATLAAVLELSEEQVDELFIAASQITA